MNKNNVWFITAKTNLHVGNENTSSYGLIDLAIQRNATTGLPCINSSSLKGALNEYASQGNNGEEIIEASKRKDIFGCDKKGKGDTQKGNYTFFDANILFLPVQDDKNLYHLATSETVVERFIAFLKVLGTVAEDYSIDNFKSDIQNSGAIDSSRFASIDWNADMADLCSDDNLPIIARNVLENGESKNLWYEQVLPAETVLYTLIDGRNDNTLETAINDKIVQIGAGATIGYGYSKFTNLK